MRCEYYFHVWSWWRAQANGNHLTDLSNRSKYFMTHASMRTTGTIYLIIEVFLNSGGECRMPCDHRILYFSPLPQVIYTRLVTVINLYIYIYIYIYLLQLVMLKSSNT